jgi:hypothetical protein
MTLSSIAADEQKYMDFMDDFIDMHQSHWQKLGMAGHFVDWPHARELHKEMATTQIKHDRLRLLKIMLNDQCIGYEYIYKFSDMYCWFLGARTDLSQYPQIDFYRISFREKVNQAIKDRIKRIDALRGHYEYKLKLGGKLYPIHSITIHSKKGVACFRYRVFKKLVWLLDVIYMKIWRRRLSPRLKIIPGPQWKMWIKTHMLAVK